MRMSSNSVSQTSPGWPRETVIPWLLTEDSLKSRRTGSTPTAPTNTRRHYGLMDNAALSAPRDMRALVVDDEAPLVDVVASYLKRESFDVHVAHDGHNAVNVAREVDPDVVILDIGLPGVDGIEVCRQLRVFSDAYVIMLTARDTEVDTIVGLSVGADDYVTKPFSPRELVARVRAVLRRPRRAIDPVGADRLRPPRRFGALAINVDSREVHLEDTPVMLTRTEFDILAALSSHAGAVLTRRQLLESVWGDTWVGNDNVVDVHVGHLRRK